MSSSPLRAAMLKFTASLAYSLVFFYALPCYGSSNLPSYGLCDVGDDITSLKGRIVGNDGVDCTRVLLAPKGYRIKITYHAKSSFVSGVDGYMDIVDGGTRYENDKHVRFLGSYVYNEDQIVTSTSNAVLIHMNKLSSFTTLNMTFVMFRQAPGRRCECLSVREGELSVCILSTDIYRGDSLERKCTVNCKPDHFVPIQNFFAGSASSSMSLRCSLDHVKSIEDKWIMTVGGRSLQDQNLVTCSKFNPATVTVSTFTFKYNNVSCEEVDVKFIEGRVREHIVNSTSVPEFGECFKVVKSPNCTVQSLNVSCSSINNGTVSQMKLLIHDNILPSDNLTITGERYKDLLDSFHTNLTNSLAQFIPQNLALSNVNAGVVTPLPGTLLGISCPQNEISPYFEHNSMKGCIACPEHFHDIPYVVVHRKCENCPNGTRREDKDPTCIPGQRNYPEPSSKYCQHTCGLGKYFNFNSSLCEWCPYGSYQNSSSTVNPVCQSCPKGMTTGFVGARNISHCIHLCLAGYYLNSLTCKMCNVGYFMPNQSHRFHKCLQCPSGNTTLNAGTNHSSGCVDKCSAGEYFNITQAGCVLCPNNTYQDEVKSNNTRSCKSCPQITVTAHIGSKTSSACLGPCGSGQFVDARAGKCAPCPKNTYYKIQQHVSFACIPCGEYKITQNTGSGNVSECIYDCGQGEFFNTTINQCMVCPIDTYQDQVGQDFCMPCPGKTFTVKNGSKECISPCFYGQLLNKSAEKCQDCPKGYYQNISEYKSETCFPCPLDFYNNKFGRRNCTACAGKTITLIMGASHPLNCINPCEPGTFLNKSSKSCRECSKGFYQDQQDYRLHDCLKCPSANLTTIGNGAASLEQCVGYCASYRKGEFPCLNGGECIDKDGDFNCTCPKYLSGKRCEVIIDGKDTDSVEASVRFPNLVWNQNLSNTESQEFIELARIVEDNLRQEFKSDANFRTVKVKELRPGSVISILELVFTYGLNFTAPADKLSVAIADGKLGTYSVDRFSLQVVNFTCTQPLGMENGRIPNSAITSSRSLDYHPPQNARLNFPGPGWAPIILSGDVYLQVDFQEEVMLTAVTTQGSSYHGGSWLQTYYLKYSLDGSNWIYYQGDSVKHDVGIAHTHKEVFIY